METSIYKQYVDKLFKPVSHGVIEKLNGSENALTYRHKTMLRDEFSVSGKWDSITINGTLVAADVVALDSPLPLKTRDSLSKASGDIPKKGMELKLNEQQMQDIDTLIATGGQDAVINQKLFADTPKVIGGIYEENEAEFLQGLSTGVALVDANNVGTGIRVDYKYPAENKFGVSKLWSDVTSTPLTDIATKILAKASLDGNMITKVMIDPATFANIAKSNEAKDLYAMYIGNFGTTKPTPNKARLNEAVSQEYGYVFDVVDRTVIFEKNGIKTPVKPWAAGAVVGLGGEIVGTLTYAKLAEQNHPVAGVTYELVDGKILVSKYRQNKPSLGEFTSSQARVVPIVSEAVYLIDSTTVQA
jgi:hypothetical protein